MRISGGSRKGFLLKSPKVANVRPTTDMIKEALFNILPSVAGKTFLDLFAGTGSVGIEALSRGALMAFFVERNGELAKSIKEHIQRLDFEENAKVIQMDMKKGILHIARLNVPFDYIFIDPPYLKGLIEDTLSRIDKADVVNPDAWIVVQHSKREPITLTDKRYRVEDQRTYGDSMLSFIKIKKQADEN